MLRLPRANDEVAALPAEVWNRTADELERLANTQIAPPLEMTDGPAGRRLGIRLRPDRLYWGVVQCHGPLGTEADYTDNRYWVALAFVSNDQTEAPTAPVAVTAYASTDPRYKVVTATNFFEENDGTHLVRPQTVVRLWAEFDHGTPAQLRWTMIVADQGTNKSAPCSPGSSSSSSSSASSSASSSGSALSSASGSSSQSASGSASSSSGGCPPGINGMLMLGGPVSRVGDTLEQTQFLLTFCNGLVVSAESAGTIAVNLCCGSGSASGSDGSSASSGSASSSGSESSGNSGSGGGGGGGSGSSSSSSSSSNSNNSSNSGSSGSSSSNSSNSSSSSSSSGCQDPNTATCDANCVDADLPSSVVLDTSALTICPAGCQTMPSSITLYSIGTCANPDAPLFLGEDGSGQIIAVIDWNPTNGCFYLQVQGSASAPDDCQTLIWAGCGGFTGIYTRLCGTAGGCATDANVLTLTVS